ncbi:hypothetical protein EYZ11_006229 [Aspergillus tanneri]|uniref:Uncharacterized protein n=1 Tax=Aspergillus tanneri TaxID=1220188 RepID=A0A4S3JG08_9EURO|nr:hypothetical protein EYZ11_006229 [Aspergillus tanneri]
MALPPLASPVLATVLLSIGLVRLIFSSRSFGYSSLYRILDVAISAVGHLLWDEANLDTTVLVGQEAVAGILSSFPPALERSGVESFT